MEYTAILYELLSGNTYLSLATADENGTPWASPVVYEFDETHGNLFFISAPDSRHIRNISKNPTVAFSIYNSAQTVGNAFGIQWSGRVEEVDSMDVPAELRSSLLSKVSMIVLNRSHRFYKIMIDKIYLPHAERWKNDKPLRILVMKNNKNNP